MSSPLCHFELMVSDPERARAFYGKILGWSFDDESMPGYTLINTGHEPTGGVFKCPENTPAACANIYFKVNDIEATLAAAAEMGANVLVPKTEIPGVGHFAMFADPEGIPIGVMQQSE